MHHPLPPSRWTPLVTFLSDICFPSLNFLRRLPIFNNNIHQKYNSRSFTFMESLSSSSRLIDLPDSTSKCILSSNLWLSANVEVMFTSITTIGGADQRNVSARYRSMVSILNGNSEHVAHAQRQTDILETNFTPPTCYLPYNMSTMYKFDLLNVSMFYLIIRIFEKCMLILF